MPLINFSTPIMEKNTKIKDDSIIQIDVSSNNENSKAARKKAEKIEEKEKYIELKENELREREEMLKRREEKIKTIICAMVAKDEEIKRKEAYLIKLIPKI